MKFLIVFALAGIVGVLLFAGMAMVRDGRDGKPKTDLMMRALAVRVGISVSLFVCILLSYKLGWIHPSGIPLR